MFCCFFFLMIRRPPRSTLSSSSAASDVYKRQNKNSAKRINQHDDSEDDEEMLLGDKSIRVDDFEQLHEVFQNGDVCGSCGEVKVLPFPPPSKVIVPLSADELHSRMCALSLIHISEPTRLLSISYAVFCLKKKKTKITKHIPRHT
eukprot:TRINITY_DN17371_c0_g1_i5.p2 TRINITY_DN17371_c0_g1~~TRINITY_DN17371_c0_g1_i5.p2  ORF type:complete len:146 (+),score=42.16 TRINITY_DN17371_c0_g1_i5:69-506(+)